MLNTKFIIIYDTYCGWCYGAAPIFDALVASGAEVEGFHRHLFQGPLAYKMSEGKGEQVLISDARIHALTGRPFSETYRQNVVLSETEVLNSQYSAQAAALVHDRGIRAEFALRQRLEHARFVGGTSASDRKAVVDALIAEGISSEEAERIGTPELEEKAAHNTRRAKDWMAKVGSRGVPTVVKVVGDHISTVDHAAYYGRPHDISQELGAISTGSTGADP